MLTEARLVQLENALSPILVTPLGMLTEVMELYWNVPCPIPTTGIQVFEMLEKRELGTVNGPVGTPQPA
jgi:hypothetical protein